MTTIGLEVVLSIVFGFLGGRWLDGKLGSEPWLLIVGTAFGVAAATRFLWRASKRMQAMTERDGFKTSSTGRSARFALEQKEREGR